MGKNNLEYILDSKVDKSSIKLNPENFTIFDNKKGNIKIIDYIFDLNNFGLITTTTFNKNILSNYLISQEGEFINKINFFEYNFKDLLQIKGSLIEFKDSKSKDLILKRISRTFGIIGIYKFNKKNVGYNLVNN